MGQFNLSLSVLVPSPLPATAAELPPCTLLSSSNGLLCFYIPSSYSFLVCDFLARSSKIIEFPTYSFAFQSLTFVSTHLGYKIAMLCPNFSLNSAFVYDSAVHSWTKFEFFVQIFCENHHQEGIIFNGSLYFTTPEPFAKLCFDLESGKWEKQRVELAGELTFVRLVVSDGIGNGKLYLIGGIGRNEISRSVKVWELRDEEEENGRWKWVGIESLPAMKCRKFLSVCYHNYERLYLFWHQGMICVCCYAWPEIL